MTFAQPGIFMHATPTTCDAYYYYFFLLVEHEETRSSCYIYDKPKHAYGTIQVNVFNNIYFYFIF